MVAKILPREARGEKREARILGGLGVGCSSQRLPGRRALTLGRGADCGAPGVRYRGRRGEPLWRRENGHPRSSPITQVLRLRDGCAVAPLRMTTLGGFFAQEFFDNADAGADAVDVPGGDACHAAALSGADAVRNADVKGLRVGVVKQLDSDAFQPGVKACFDDTIAKLVAAGAEVVTVDCPSFEYAIAAYYLILPAEASSNLAKFDSVRFGLRVAPEGNPTIERVMAATREAGFGPEVKRRIILGTYALSSGSYEHFYGAALKVRTLIQRDFAAAFEKADVLISPTAPTTAFKIGEKVNDPLAMYLNDIATIPANLAGIPGMSVPNGLASEDGLPSGVQILAPAMQDAQMYRVGSIIEQMYLAEWGAPLIAKAPKLEVL